MSKWSLPVYFQIRLTTGLLKPSHEKWSFVVLLFCCFCSVVFLYQLIAVSVIQVNWKFIAWARNLLVEAWRVNCLFVLLLWQQQFLSIFQAWIKSGVWCLSCVPEWGVLNSPEEVSIMADSCWTHFLLEISNFQMCMITGTQPSVSVFYLASLLPNMVVLHHSFSGCTEMFFFFVYGSIPYHHSHSHFRFQEIAGALESSLTLPIARGRFTSWYASCPVARDSATH